MCRGLVQLAEGSRHGSPTALCFKIYPPDLVNADEMAREVATLMDLSQSDSFPAYKGLLVHQRSPIVVSTPSVPCHCYSCPLLSVDAILSLI